MSSWNGIRDKQEGEWRIGWNGFFLETVRTKVDIVKSLSAKC